MFIESLYGLLCILIKVYVKTFCDAYALFTELGLVKDQKPVCKKY
jgi:hypothetical protein